ncbi:MAG: DUF599 family protein [Pseudomonadales bacterium]|uniref:Putative membrane protein n=1 Tax=Oleiphilus messinensis TaxID=141451 RepID=A0A1Y0IDM1_9GAMM|nr:DUF599 family protein [Oleiphilus messinensis]ARU57483.1 putative membrane protein [Oleiphilus messinensis]MCG8612505.1 DUF599 family protein [Pseudomonadales bacterium]
MSFTESNLLDIVALVWFLVCWIGYGVYSSRKSKSVPSLSNTLDLYRADWMSRFLMRENRIADASVVGNLERNGAFFASSSLLIIAGILTALGYTDKALELFSDIPFAHLNSRMMWEIKLSVMMVVFVYAFFKFTWAMRQYNFCAVLIGSAPLASESKVSPRAREAFAQSAAQVANHAGDAFNLGLRSYYYALAVLSWFVHPVLFMVISTAVVVILHHREFESRALKALRAGKVFEDEGAGQS